MILEAAAVFIVATAVPQSVGADIADLQRRLQVLREQADQPPPPPGPTVLHTAADFRREARRALIDTLRDPASARFRDVRRYPAPNGYTFCGEVNARNGFGGMTGFIRFQAFANADGRTNAVMDDLDHQPGRSYFQAGWNRDCAGTGEPVQF
jgi:hypothetical protein